MLYSIADVLTTDSFAIIPEMSATEAFQSLNPHKVKMGAIFAPR